MARLDIDRPGLIVPVLTPFAPDGQVDEARLAEEIELLVSHKPAMLAVAAVEAQEYQYLSDDQRKNLIKATARHINGRVPMVVGVSHPSLSRAGELAELAYSLGAQAAQILIPNRPSGGAASTDELVDYVTAIGRRSPLPLVIYHNPGPGATLGPQPIVRLFKIPEVVACKESSRNLRHVGTVLSQVDSDKGYFVTMEVLSAGLELGCAGGTLPPPAAFIGQRIVDAFREGRYEDMMALQRTFTAFPGPWIKYGLVSVMKVAFEALGVSLGGPYAPFGGIPSEDREDILAYVRSTTLFEEA